MDKVWSLRSVHYRVHWYRHSTIPSDGSEMLVASLGENAHPTGAALLRYTPFGSIHIRVFSTVLSSRETFDKNVGQRVNPRRLRVLYRVRAQLGRD